MNMAGSLSDVFNFKADGSDDALERYSQLVKFTADLMSRRLDDTDVSSIHRKAALYGIASDTNMKPETRTPLVFIINGYGGSGKDTLISRVQAVISEVLSPHMPTQGFIANISPIYPAIKNAIEALTPDMPVMLKYTSMMDDYAPGEIFTKTPEWRTLAHEIKNAWNKVNNGANVWILSKVIRAVTSDEKPGAIFIHVRERENIIQLREALVNMGFVTMSILVAGRVQESKQPEDRTVFDYEYDIVIDNSEKTGNLWVSAYKVAILTVASMLLRQTGDYEAVGRYLRLL